MSGAPQTAPLLNIDAGEFSSEPAELFTFAHAINIACGGHAGDAASMRLALSRCAESGSQPGAHPSYPDRDNFGRVALRMELSALEATVRQQCEALAVHARELGMTLAHAKPHGALYHAVASDAEVALALVRGVRGALGADVVVVGPPHGALQAAATELGCAYRREGFADRGMRPDGSLIPRGEHGALLEDPREAATQALRLARTRQYETLCVHGDTPGSLSIAAAVRAALDTYSP